MVLLLFFVDFESEGVVVIEEDAEEIVKVDLLVPLGDLVDVVGHDQVRQSDLILLLLPLPSPWASECVILGVTS